MGGKPRPKREFKPWGKMKPEDYSCHVPWDTEWKQIEASMTKEFGGEHIVLPMPGILRLEGPDVFGRGEQWRVVGYWDSCGHWTEHPDGGELCGVYTSRKGAEGALVCAAKGACWDCLMKAWEPIFKMNKEREKADDSRTNAR